MRTNGDQATLRIRVPLTLIVVSLILLLTLLMVERTNRPAVLNSSRIAHTQEVDSGDQGDDENEQAEDENENENEHEKTPTPTPVVTMTPTATPVVEEEEEEEEEFVTVINGVVFECEPTDHGQGRDHGRHLGQLKHEDEDEEEEAFITVINGVQVICEAEEEDEFDED